MPNPPEQIVLVQVSDVHIEANLFNTTVGSVSGWRGHDFLLCQRLGDALRKVRRDTGLTDAEKLYVTLTGDLTRTGSHGDFAAGQSYFHCKRPLSFDADLGDVGLGLPPDQALLIPGNHDHWTGIAVPPQPPFNAGIFPQQFRTPAWRRVLVSPRRGIALELYGLDSNSGLTGLSGAAKQAWARGSISNAQLKQLAADLATPPAPHEKAFVHMKTVLVHHSFSIPLGRTAAQTLDSASAVSLLVTASRHGVDAILTGHTHTLRVDYFYAPGVQPPRPVWEFRCPTTLQCPATAGWQGFLVHQIVLDDRGKPCWKVWLYVWDGVEFFRSGAAPLQTLP